METTANPVHICFERILPLALEDEARRRAIRENPANEVDPSINPNDPNLPPEGRIALVADKRWRPGKILKARFLDGSPGMQAKVAQHAQEWTQYANIRFEFGSSEQAEIRISFYADQGSWSALGTDALVEDYFPLTQPTMNFGWLREETDDQEYARVVLHEFGHALGAIHEHQNPAGGIQWNEDAVYAYFSGPPNYWTREQIFANVIEKYRAEILLGTEFDPKSIMLYDFPPELTQNGKGTRPNDGLSAKDIEFIKSAYPGGPGALMVPRIGRPPPPGQRVVSAPNHGARRSRPSPTVPSRGEKAQRAPAFISAPAPGPARRANGSAATGPTFRALLIGIDFYDPNRLPNEGTYRSLNGCVRDVERVEEMLCARVPQPLVIHKLVAPNIGDRRPSGPPSSLPTYRNMKAAFDALVAAAQPGDQVYIHYAGHGGRTHTNLEGLKGADGFDETLVPMDIGERTTRYLRDHEIAYYLDALTTKKRATVTIVLDSCHSGGATRGVDVAPRCATGARPGTDPTLDTTKRPASDVAAADELLAAWRRLTESGSGRREVTGTTWLPEAKDYVLLAACRDIETAFEANLDGNPRGGVLTAAFLEALKALDGDQTWKTLYEGLLASVHARFPAQTPQLLGEGARQVLGVELRPVANTATVSEIDAPNLRVKLDTGEVTGTTPGSTFGIYRRGTTNFARSARRVGAATVDEVSAAESWATLGEGASIAAVELGAPAVLEDVGSVKLQYSVLPFRRNDLPPDIDQDRALDAVRAAIQTTGRGFLVLHTSGTPTYQVALDEEGRYVIWDGSGQPLPNTGAVAASAPGAADRVVERIIHVIRYNAILGVSPPSSGLEVTIDLYEPPPGWSVGKPPGGGAPMKPINGTYEVTPEDFIVIRIENKSGAPINVAVIDFGDDWAITAVDPQPPRGRTVPSRRYSSVDRGQVLWFAFQTYLPAGRTSAIDVIKVFATIDDTDFWWLLHPPIERPVTRSLTTRADAARDALSRLRDALDADWNADRAVRPVSEPGSDWTTRQFHITTRSGGGSET